LSWLSFIFVSLLFILFCMVFIGLSGYFILQALRISRRSLIDLPLSLGIGLTALFFWQYLNVALQLSGVIFFLPVVVLVWLSYRNQKQLFEYFHLYKLALTKKWLLILFFVLILTWTLPTLTTGLTNKEGDLILSVWLGGERLMMTGHGTSVYQELPPTHPYWLNVPLQYHYFGTVIQTAIARFGFDSLIANFWLIPTLIGFIVSAFIYQIAFGLTKKILAGVFAVIVFFLWDSAGYLFSQDYTYVVGRWWQTVFTDHKHAYINGNSHQFSTLFTALFMYFLYLATILKERRYLYYFLSAVTGGALLLFKAQAFLAVAGAITVFFIGWLLSIIWCVNFKNILDWFKSGLAFLAGYLLVILPLLWHNRAVLLAEGEQNVIFAPFNQAVGSFNNVPKYHELILQTINFPANQLHYWFANNPTQEVIILFFKITLLSIGGAVFLKLLGLIPLFTLWKEKPENRLAIFSMGSLGLMGILLTYGTLLTLGNQWQFIFSAFLPLSILTAVFISRLKWSAYVFIILTLLAIPNGLGVIYDSPLDRTLPIEEVSVVKDIKMKVRPNDLCFFALPINTDDPNSPVDIFNQTREIMYPAFAGCKVVAAMGPKPILNYPLKDTEYIHHELKPELLALEKPEDVLHYLEKYGQRIVWLAPNNRYQLTDEHLLSLDYVKQSDISTGEGGAVFIKN